MSGFIAIVGPEDHAVAPAVVDRMLDAAAERGRDRRDAWIAGPVALGHCQLAVAAEARPERQPHASESGIIRLVLDGRFDNRDELAGAFEAARRPLRTDTDAELLLRAYELWGDDCAGRLLGDFAFAIWDARRRALVCARDVLGTRPLYFHARAGHFVAASEIVPLLRHPAVNREPNEGFLAECLNGAIIHRRDTVWRDVARLEPAHLLVVECGRVATRCYWSPNPRSELHYRSDEDYAEHLADLVRKAVHARVRASGCFGVMLSGGIDSSSIVGALHELRLAGADSPLPTYSLCDPREPWDDTPYIDAVAAMWPISSRRLLPFEASSDFFAAEASKYQDLPPYPNGLMARPIFEAAVEANARVLLTGLWSDEWFSGSFMHYADLLRGLRFGQFWRHYRAQPDRLDVFRPTSMFRSTIWPLVPAAARQAIKAVLGRDGIAPWMDRRFAATTDLAARVRPTTPTVKLRTLAKTESWTWATSGLSVHATEAENRATTAYGIETRHPYGDRRILEFGLALPEDQRWRGPFPKYVLRQAAREWLPPIVRDRLTSATASSVLVRAVEGHVAAGLWHNAVIGRRGWVDLPLLHAAFDDMMRRYRAGDDGYDRLAFPLWLVCAVEIFARHVLEERRDD